MEKFHGCYSLQVQINPKFANKSFKKSLLAYFCILKGIHLKTASSVPICHNSYLDTVITEYFELSDA